MKTEDVEKTMRAPVFSFSDKAETPSVHVRGVLVDLLDCFLFLQNDTVPKKRDRRPSSFVLY
jgi:hypothetical protein